MAEEPPARRPSWGSCVPVSAWKCIRTATQCHRTVTTVDAPLPVSHVVATRHFVALDLQGHLPCRVRPNPAHARQRGVLTTKHQELPFVMQGRRERRNWWPRRGGLLGLRVCGGSTTLEVSMIRDRVRSFCSQTVSSNSTALLPIAAPRPGVPGWGWLRAAGRPRIGESRSRAYCPDRGQVVSSLVLLGCGVLFGLLVGGYVGLMENATPHGRAPSRYEQTASSSPAGKWAAMVRQYRVTSGGGPESAAQSQGTSRPQPLAAAASIAAEPPASAVPVFSTDVGPSTAQTGGKHGK